MIRAIANKPVALEDEEYAYYLSIIEAFGDKIFQDTFEVNEDENSNQYGWITLVTPPLNNQLPMGVIFYLFNVQHNQRFRRFEELMARFENEHR